MAGYSGTPLVKKLGIKQGFKVFVKNPPCEYGALLVELPENVEMVNKLKTELDMIHLFTRSRRELKNEIKKYQSKIKQAGMIWVSWPKKASNISTDVTEDVIREIVLPLGLVDVKVCAVDDIWSGLKLVIRTENRK